MVIDLLEYRVLSIIRQRLYYNRYLHLLREDLFETPQTRYIFNLISTFHTNHKSDNITIRSLRILLTTSVSADKRGAYRGIVNRIRKGVVKEPSVIEDLVKRFAKRQLLKHAVMEAIDSLESGEEADLERVRQRVDEAISVDQKNVEESYDYFKEAGVRVKEEERENRLPTRLARELDNSIGGGLAAGELGIIIAPTGVGKTLALVNIGVGALLQGKKVVHATLEIKARKAARRYDTRLCKRSYKDLIQQQGLVSARVEKLRKIGAGLQIKDYTAELCSVQDLKTYVERLFLKKFIPDLLIVDHADLMYSPRKFKERRYELSSIVAGLRRLGNEFGIPVWTASQATRKAGEAGKTRLWDIAEDIGKANWADVAITISQTEDEKEEGVMYLKVAKNRIDKGNPRVQVWVDYDTMTMAGRSHNEPRSQET